MNGEQTRLDGTDLSVEEVEENGPKCQHRDTDGERCGFYAVVRVTAASGEILACPTHAKQSWLDAAGFNEHE